MEPKRRIIVHWNDQQREPMVLEGGSELGYRVGPSSEAPTYNIWRNNPGKPPHTLLVPASSVAFIEVHM